jgi:hypothetical protein
VLFFSQDYIPHNPSTGFGSYPYLQISGQGIISYPYLLLPGTYFLYIFLQGRAAGTARAENSLDRAEWKGDGHQMTEKKGRTAVARQ